MFPFPNKLELAQIPTPIQTMEKLSSQWNIDLRVKRDDLTGSVLTGNKIRKLEYLLAECKQQNCDTVISCGATTSNHARATAIAARKLGLDVVLILAGDPPQKAEGNLQIDLLVGSRVKYISRKQYSSEIEPILKQEASALRDQGKHPYIIPTGGSNAVGLIGYVEAAQEIKEQCEKINWFPDTIVCAVGSGGTYAGLFLGNSIFRVTEKVLGVLVCGDIEQFQEKVIADVGETCRQKEIDLPNFNEINLLDGYFGEGYAKTNPEQLQFIQYVANQEGLILDPVYTGKALWGLYGEVKKRNIKQNTNVLFIHTGGVFGLSAFSDSMHDIWPSLEKWEGVHV